VMKLCVRRTFFDEIAAEHSSVAHRSRSSPPCSTNLSACAAQSSYDNYVAEVQNKAARLTALSFHPLLKRDVQEHADKCQSATISKSKHRRQECSLSDATTSSSVCSDSESSDHETNSMQGCTDQSVDANGGDCKGSWLDSNTSPQTAALQNHTVAKMVFLSKALEDAVPEPCVPAHKSELEIEIPGNWGHPELCGRPCIFFARGECTNGDSCRFCHLPHRKLPHFDKRGRALWKAMTPEQRGSLIAPLVMRKAAALQLEEQASELLKDVVHTNALGFTIVADKRLSGMKQSMENMSMRQLLSMALNGDGDAEGSQFARGHIDQMRLAIKDHFRFLKQ